MMCVRDVMCVCVCGDVYECVSGEEAVSVCVQLIILSLSLSSSLLLSSSLRFSLSAAMGDFVAQLSKTLLASTAGGRGRGRQAGGRGGRETKISSHRCQSLSRGAPPHTDTHTHTHTQTQTQTHTHRHTHTHHMQRPGRSSHDCFPSLANAALFSPLAALSFSLPLVVE